MNRLFAVIFGVLVFLTCKALAQGPGSLNSGSQLASSGSSGAYTFSWWGAAGYTYLMETSDDLINWTYLPVVESGTGAAIQWGFTSTSSSLFMKLEYITVPVDQLSGAVFDGPDNNGNGLPDDWELFYYGTLGVDPNASVSWSNGTLTNLQAYQEGLSPLFGINLSVSLPAGVTNAALVWSDHTTGTETGYEILRETGTTGFQSIGFVLSGATNYNDYAVQGSTTYLYQVVALNGPSQVASSNQASIATLLDSNGDGIADIYKATYGIDPNDGTNSVGGSGLPDGWLIQYGLNPFTVTDASVDLIGKGWSLGDDYANGTNPNMVDTDGDGVSDSQDEYPLDPRRSQDIQAPPIALLNVSGTIATSNVTQIAIDDNDDTAFGIGGMYGPANFEAYLWQSGTATQTANVTLSGYNGDDFRWVSSIDTLGNVYGDDYYDGGFKYQSGSMVTLYPPNPPYSGGPSYATTFFGFASRNGLSYSLEYSGMVTSTLYPDLGEIEIDSGAIQSPSGIAIFDPEFAEYGIDVPAGIQVIDTDFDYYGINDYGDAYGWSSLYGPTYWNGEELVPLPGTPYDGYTQNYGLNDQGQVIGISGGEINVTSGTAAYLWTSGSGGTGTTASIANLLPPSYQKQIQNIFPFLISNQNPSDGSVKIYFNAQSLEGPGQGQWEPRTFMLQTMGTPDATGTVAQLTQIQMPAGSSVSLSQANASGVCAGIGTADDSDNTESAYLALPVNFEPADSSDDSTIEKGFDPPMRKDHTQGDGYVDLVDSTNQFSNLKPEWWTSVAGSGTSSASQKVKIVFPDAVTASSCHMQITAGSSAIVSVKDSSGNDLLGATSHFTAKETTLTISGTNTTNSTIPATLQVAGLSGSNVPILHADVMPMRNITVGIYYVTDTNSIGTSSNPMTELPTGMPDINTIISNLNLIYQQACITFTSGSSSGTKSVPYDSGTNGNGDGYLNTIVPTDAECAALNSVAREKLNVIIVGKLKYIGAKPATDVAGVYPGSGNIVYVFAQKLTDSSTPMNVTDTFIVCQDVAHEIGHALGLSTRTDDTIGHNNDTNGISNHDGGPFPIFVSSVTGSWVLDLKALMYYQLDINHHYWMRHEDWKAANTNAPKYQ